MRNIRRIVFAILIAAGTFAPSCARQAFADKPALVPTFESNIYGLLPVGDFSAVFRYNAPRWYASAETATELANRYDAVPVMRDDYPQTGPMPRGWTFVEVPDSLVNLAMKLENRTGSVREAELAPLLGLPRAKMWVLRWPNGCVVNAGYLAGYYLRNPEAQFPNLADRYVKQIVAGECAQ